MIPAHDAGAHLAETLQSVLAHDLPPGTQVEVVDDASTDDTAAIAAAFADRGVTHHRNPRRLGAPANFNACLRRARGRLVHLLHADDLVLPGFYHRMGRAMETSGAVAAVCRTEYVDETGRPLGVGEAMSATGIWTDVASRLALTNVIRPPGIVVDRAAYDAVGGYREDLRHAADWDMWIRLAEHGPVWFDDRVLARYRRHEANHTAGVVKSGANVVERAVVLEGMAARSGGRRHLRRGLAYSSVFAARLGSSLAVAGDWSGASVQFRAAAACVVGSVGGTTRPVHGLLTARARAATPVVAVHPVPATRGQAGPSRTTPASTSRWR